MALAFFAFAATCTQAAPVDVYRGTLGGADVVMELGQPKPGGEREGRYFYVRNGVDIPLKVHEFDGQNWEDSARKFMQGRGAADA